MASASVVHFGITRLRVPVGRSSEMNRQCVYVQLWIIRRAAIADDTAIVRRRQRHEPWNGVVGSGLRYRGDGSKRDVFGSHHSGAVERRESQVRWELRALLHVGIRVHYLINHNA